MEVPNICCSLYKALMLDPVPVIGDEVYVPGAEGVNLRSLREDTAVELCTAHRYNFKHTVDTLLSRASEVRSCSCEAARVSVGSLSLGERMGESGRMRETSKKTRRRRPRGSAKSQGFVAPTPSLWAYELQPVAAAYKWLMRHRSSRYPKCCEAILVYQMNRSQYLPPGLYVYRSRPSHSNCTVERPVTVVDQFNFMVEQRRAIDGTPPCGTILPDVITLDVFPGRDNFSALYVIDRRVTLQTFQYGNRLCGEAIALGLMKSEHYAKAVPCEYHQVGMRTDRTCVIDLRWNAFDTMSACLKAVPRIRGMRAVVWSNHTEDSQKIESDVLAWALGYVNALPNTVHFVDHRNEMLGIRYMFLSVDGFKGALPDPPIRERSYFIHTSFEGDRNLTNAAVGEVPGVMIRMASPSPDTKAFTYWYELPSSLGFSEPTPFSSGMKVEQSPVLSDDLRPFEEWARKENDVTGCFHIAVQHTLYYHAAQGKYKLMVSHIVKDADTTVNMFKL